MPSWVAGLAIFGVIEALGIGLMWAGRRWTQGSTGEYGREQSPISGGVDGKDLTPDAAAELTLVRAQAAALKAARCRGLKKARARLRERSSSRLAPGHVNKQRHRSLVLLIFGAVRVAAWLVLGVMVACGLAGVSGFGWAKTVAESLPFIALISIYANAATDVDAATAAFAALVASDSHAAVVATGATLAADLDALQADIEKLAGLVPGEEATALAAAIRKKLVVP